MNKTFVGNPCKHNHHPTIRRIDNGDCVSCMRNRTRLRHKTKRIEENTYARKMGVSRRARERTKRPWYYIIARILYLCKKNNRPCDLTYKWAQERYTGFCELSSLPFRHYSISTIDSISVDRIDPKKGYVQSNCRFILNGLNSLKSVGSDADVIRVCKAVVARHG